MGIDETITREIIAACKIPDSESTMSELKKLFKTHWLDEDYFVSVMVTRTAEIIEKYDLLQTPVAYIQENLNPYKYKLLNINESDEWFVKCLKLNIHVIRYNMRGNDV